jgi:hypothetical protein
LHQILSLFLHIGYLCIIRFLFIGKGDSLDYKILTTDKEMIAALLHDLERTWSTPIRTVPNGAATYTIMFDSDSDPIHTGHNGFIIYYPEFDVYAFIDASRKMAYSLSSSESLKKIVQQHGMGT